LATVWPINPRCSWRLNSPAERLRTIRDDIRSINPATGEPFATHEEWPTEKAQNVVGKIHRDYLAWRRTGFDRRASLMRNAADILNWNARDYAKLMAEEMGKPLHDGVADVEKCAKTAGKIGDLVWPDRGDAGRTVSDQDPQIEAAIVGSCSLPGGMPQARANHGVPDAVRAFELLTGRQLPAGITTSLSEQRRISRPGTRKKRPAPRPGPRAPKKATRPTRVAASRRSPGKKASKRRTG
jgi:Aldehyde dehydrogenase family